MTDHEHNYQYQGLVYWEDEQPRAGTSVRDRYYADRYFCTVCLEHQDMNVRQHGDSFWPVIAGAVPS